MLGQFFDVFLFEDMPATSQRADSVYLQEVARCDIYLALLGNEYGGEDSEGLSPTQREYDLAASSNKHRIVFVKGDADSDKSKHVKMQALIKCAGLQLIRRRFSNLEGLTVSVYASLVEYLSTKNLLRLGPFDAAACQDATLKDLSEEKISHFVSVARRARGFPLGEDAPPLDILQHLHLVKNDRPTNAAILLFGKTPQKFLISSEIKCAHFHGTQVRKPIPSYQTYKGTVFDLVDQAVDFVLSKINLSVGTRELSSQVPVAYEIPPEVVREAIVNAVAHRDYTSNGSVQVMLFSDRLEIWNPGALPPSLSLDMLRHPHGSVPGNPLLAEPLYLTKYIERMGTGTGDMIWRCRNANLPEPEFTLPDGFVATIRRKSAAAFESVGGHIAPPVTPPVTLPVAPPVALQIGVLLRLLAQFGPQGNTKIREHLGLKDRAHLRERYVDPALADGLVEYTIPDKPHSRLQKYRLTPKGIALLESLQNEAPKP